jgi:hypothetical protein
MSSELNERKISSLESAEMKSAEIERERILSEDLLKVRVYDVEQRETGPIVVGEGSAGHSGSSNVAIAC